MRVFLVVAATLALCACERGSDTQVVAGCMRTATHEVTWTYADAADVITTSSQGPTCQQAVVTLVVRNASGDPLWSFASMYYGMRFGGLPPENAPSVPVEDMEAFLASWADTTTMRSGELPQWNEDEDAPAAADSAFTYETPLDREAYRTQRDRNLPMICYAAGVETTQCLIAPPGSRTPSMIVAYGP